MKNLLIENQSIQLLTKLSMFDFSSSNLIGVRNNISG